MKVLIFDNYDSFVYNLAQYVGSLGCEPIVVRNDKIGIQEVKRLAPDRIIISPGPGDPSDRKYFGVCEDVLHEVSPELPTLGVCLGHQGIGTAFGGRIARIKPMHGKTSVVKHDGKGVLKGVKNPFEAARYHSLVIDGEGIPPCLKVSARSTDDGQVMGVRHVRYPIEGVQFHPESIMTTEGMKIVLNFVERGVQW